MKLRKIIATIILVYLSANVCAEDATSTFSGRYEFRSDRESLEIIGKQVCFYPSQPSSRAAPRPAGDKRLAWFCFSNSASAAKTLGFDLSTTFQHCGVQGTASIKVSNYLRYTGEEDGNDVAMLVAVSESSKPGPLPCSK